MSQFDCASAGDLAARKRLLLENLPRLKAYLQIKAGAALKSKESISDLAQSVCLQVLDDLPNFEFRSEPQFRHWLFQHALHKIINKREFYDAQKRDMRREVAAAPATDCEALSQSCFATLMTPSRHASGREQLAQFETVLEALADDYKEAINLRKVVGLDYDEIATAMGRSVGAVRNLVHRGLAKISTCLS
jgi:RNA polymerase sigma-70 factor (subfamily 1)